MKPIRTLTLLFMAILVTSCGSNASQKQNELEIITNGKNNAMILGEQLELSIKNPKNFDIGSITYSMDGSTVKDKIELKDVRLGEHTLEALVEVNGESITLTKSITILNNTTPKVYNFKLINSYPHDITSYTQGLEFYNGVLFESTGQRGESKLRKVDYKTGEVLNNLDRAKEYFGEGLTLMNDQIYQLTWTSGSGFVYDVETFEKTGSFRYGESQQGWGICNDGSTLYKSDGSEKIWTLDPNTLAEVNYIQAYHNKGKVIGLNELEWVNGKIYANRYQKNGVAIINPSNGAIEGVIDFSPLRDQVTQHEGLDVLNGIAFNPETNSLFVTGKRWDKLFEVEIITD